MSTTKKQVEELENENVIDAKTPIDWNAHIEKRFTVMAEAKRKQNTNYAQIDRRLEIGLDAFLQNEKTALKRRFTPPKQYILSQIIKAQMIASIPEMTIRASDAQKGEENFQENAITLEKTIDKFESYSSADYKKIMAWSDAVDYGTGFIMDLSNKVDGQIDTMYLNPRSVFIDEAATDTDNARDFIIRDEISWASFRARFGRIEGLKNFKTIQPYTDDAGEWKLLSQKEKDEGKGDLNEDEGRVRIYEYFSVEHQKRITIVNNIVVLEQEYTRRRIPITAYYYYKKNTCVWGIGITQLTAGVIDFENAFLNLAIENARLSLTPMYLADARTGLKSTIKMKPGKIIIGKSTGEMSFREGIQEVRMGGISIDFDKISRALTDVLTYVSRQPEREMMTNTQETATEAKIKQAAKAAQIQGMVEISFLSSEKWRYEGLIECIQELTEYWADDGNDEKERTVLIDGYWVHGEGKDQKFLQEEKAQGFMTISKETVHGKFAVEVLPPQDKQALKHEKDMAISNAMENTVNILNINPSLAESVDLTLILDHTWKNVGVEGVIKKGNEDQSIDQVETEHKNIMNGIPITLFDGETAKDSREHLIRHRKFFLTKGKELSAGQKTALIQHIEQTATNTQATAQ